MEKEPKRSLIKQIYTATLDGNAKEVKIEASFTRGLPAFSIVGLADEAIKEARDRVKSALQLSGYQFPPLKITVSLFPSDLKKSGSHMDLAIALLIALEKHDISFGDFFALAELGLDGSVRDTPMIFPLVLSLAKEGKIKRLITDHTTAKLLSHIPDLEVYAVSTLNEAIEFFANPTKPEPIKSSGLSFKKITLDQDYFYEEEFFEDFVDVKGQAIGKRAALISASGFHNLLFSGSPGSGKSMIIKRLRGILPPMSLAELLEKTSQDLLDGSEPHFRAFRSFRSPHHSATRASIFGGGSKNAKIGEVALANNGVLFFDELPHFEKTTLEALREPLEDQKLLISRVNSKVTYETSFLFAAAMNPCPCGNLYSQKRECRCTEAEISRYQNRLSDPFLDRIDLFVQMNDSDLALKPDVSSSELRAKVFEAFKMQKSRGQTKLNGKLSDNETEKICKLDIESETLLITAMEKFGISARAVGKIKRVARTIADLEKSPQIKKSHILEALSFRKR